MPDLPKRKLGRTGLRVTALGFGALEMRGMVAGVGRPLTPAQADRINPIHLQENVAAVLKGPLPSLLYNEAKQRLAAARSAYESVHK